MECRSVVRQRKVRKALSSTESKDPVDEGTTRNAERHSRDAVEFAGRTPCVAFDGTGVPGVPSASLGAGSSTALPSLCAGNCAQDDRVEVVLYGGQN
jgi:hypothetical protein